MDIQSIANPTRLRLVACLMTPHSVNELLDKCELSQSALSQHLKKLKDGGIVECSRQGNQQIYVVANKQVAKIAKQLLSLTS
jgi:DNA-binding transcriptional ArsR family regulator